MEKTFDGQNTKTVLIERPHKKSVKKIVGRALRNEIDVTEVLETFLSGKSYNCSRLFAEVSHTHLMFSNLGFGLFHYPIFIRGLIYQRITYPVEKLPGYFYDDYFTVLSFHLLVKIQAHRRICSFGCLPAGFSLPQDD